MSAEEVGAYIRLLCYQWGNGAIPQQQAVIDRIAGCHVSEIVISKFPEGKNLRMESVRSKQQAFNEKQRTKANMRWQCHGNATASIRHMPNVCSPSPSPSPIKNKIGRFAPPSQGEVEGYALEIHMAKPECEKFINYYESNGWKVGRNPMKSWKAAMRNWKNNSYGHNAITGKPGVDRNAGTANEGKADQYAGVGRVVPLPNKG